MNSVLQTESLTRRFLDGRRVIEVLRGIDFTLEDGERVAVVGPSGSGKSTFLHLCGLLDTPSDGDILVDDALVSGFPDSHRAAIRNRVFGFVFQSYHLLPEFTATENVTMPALMQSGAAAASARDRARELLDDVGLGERLDNYPATLSGGEKQRVAIARALINEPRVLLCDEPTGNLDEHTSGEIFDLLDRIHQKRGYSAVIVTHEMDLARRCDRILRLEHGKLQQS